MTWSKVPPTADEVRARAQSGLPVVAWWRAPHGGLLAVNLLYANPPPRDGEWGGWCATPDEVSARDAEIATLRAALADARDAMHDAIPRAALRGLFVHVGIEAFRRARLDGVPTKGEAIEGAATETLALVDAGTVGDWHNQVTDLRAALADAQSTLTTVEQSLAVQTARGMEIADERDRLADRVAAMGAAMARAVKCLTDGDGYGWDSDAMMSAAVRAIDGAA